MLVPFTEAVNKPKEEGDLGLGHIEAGISRIFKGLGSKSIYVYMHMERK